MKNFKAKAIVIAFITILIDLAIMYHYEISEKSVFLLWIANSTGLFTALYNYEKHKESKIKRWHN